MRLIPLAPDSKEPLPGVSWKNLISDDPADHRRWIAEGKNVGFPLRENGCSVVDFDVLDPAREFFHEHRELCRIFVLTRRGVHFFCAGHTRTRKFEHGDIKGDGSYVVFPPSFVQGHQYRFAPGYEWGRELAPFPEELFPISERRVITRKEVKDALSYIREIKAISGQHGHNSTFRAACILRDSGMDEASALAAMVEWNRTNAIPPWEVRDLLKKVRDAFRVTVR